MYAIINLHRKLKQQQLQRVSNVISYLLSITVLFYFFINLHFLQSGLKFINYFILYIDCLKELVVIIV